MKQLIYIASIIIISSCSSVKPALTTNGWVNPETHTVKGRQGFTFNQKISFAGFTTSKVNRSWTKGSGYTVTSPFFTDWPGKLQIEFAKRKQTIRFQMSGEGNALSEVTAFAKASWTDLRFGENPNSIINIAADLLQIGDERSNTFAVRIFTDDKTQPWDMLIDQLQVQGNASKYKGVLAKNKEEYYTIHALAHLQNKQGKAAAIPFGASIGFEFRSKNGEPLAAVSLIDNGLVYFNSIITTQQRFLLANAAAALLLQQEIEQ